MHALVCRAQHQHGNPSTLAQTWLFCVLLVFQALQYLKFRHMTMGVYGAPPEPQALAWQQLWTNLHALTHLTVEK
jgi:hypothetical protein